MIIYFILLFQTQMSTDKMNLLDYLPKEQKQRVLALIQRLSEETQSKNRYVGLYNKIKEEYDDLLQKYNKMKDQNSYLKHQMHNSFSMISQVRDNFKMNKEKSNAKKLQSEQWSDQNENQNEENEQGCANQTILFQNNNPPKSGLKSSLEKYKPPLTTIHKKNNHSNLQSSYFNQTSAIKNKEVEQLKKEIKTLQESKKKTEQKSKDVKEKHRLVDEIKNRYKTKNEEYSSRKSIQPEEIDISDDTFQQEESSERLISKKKQAEAIATPKLQSKRQIQKNPKQYVTNIKDNPLSQSKDGKNKNIPSSKGHIVTAQDYGDILQMINCYNL